MQPSSTGHRAAATRQQDTTRCYTLRHATPPFPTTSTPQHPSAALCPTARCYAAGHSTSRIAAPSSPSSLSTCYRPTLAQYRTWRSKRVAR
eukprot:3941536-Rhodomonas_salina.3